MRFNAVECLLMSSSLVVDLDGLSLAIMLEWPLEDLELTMASTRWWWIKARAAKVIGETQNTFNLSMSHAWVFCSVAFHINVFRHECI